jgi:nanoRNase/pAp phosphatase (c-di-AMP/oligoRNAs hydrolase)
MQRWNILILYISCSLNLTSIELKIRDKALKFDKDATVAVDKNNENRTGSSRRKQVSNSKHILIILTSAIFSVY